MHIYKKKEKSNKKVIKQKQRYKNKIIVFYPKFKVSNNQFKYLGNFKGQRTSVPPSISAFRAPR